MPTGSSAKIMPLPSHVVRRTDHDGPDQAAHGPPPAAGCAPHAVGTGHRRFKPPTPRRGGAVMTIDETRSRATRIGQQDLVSHLRSQFETHGDTRTLTFLREARRELVEDITTLGDLDRAAREVAVWLRSRPEAQRPVLLLFEPGLDFWRAFLGCI